MSLSFNDVLVPVASWWIDWIHQQKPRGADEFPKCFAVYSFTHTKEDCPQSCRFQPRKILALGGSYLEPSCKAPGSSEEWISSLAALCQGTTLCLINHHINITYIHWTTLSRGQFEKINIHDPKGQSIRKNLDKSENHYMPCYCPEWLMGPFASLHQLVFFLQLLTEG